MFVCSVLPSTTKLTIGASGDPWTKRRFPVSLLLPPPQANQTLKSRNKAKRRTPRRKCSLQCNLNVYQKLANSGNRMRAKGCSDAGGRCYLPADFRSATLLLRQREDHGSGCVDFNWGAVKE